MSWPTRPLPRKFTAVGRTPRRRNPRLMSSPQFEGSFDRRSGTAERTDCTILYAPAIVHYSSRQRIIHAATVSAMDQPWASSNALKKPVGVALYLRRIQRSRRFAEKAFNSAYESLLGEISGNFLVSGGSTILGNRRMGPILNSPVSCV